MTAERHRRPDATALERRLVSADGTQRVVTWNTGTSGVVDLTKEALDLSADYRPMPQAVRLAARRVGDVPSALDADARRLVPLEIGFAFDQRLFSRRKGAGGPPVDSSAIWR